MADRYPLEDLLRVRQFREDNAANAQTLRRRELEAARQMVVQRKKELEEYIAWRIAREDQLYQEIMDQPVKLRDLDDLKQQVLMLKEKEFAYQDKIKEAERQVTQAEQALQQAEDDYRAAVRDRQKIDEHKEHWAQEVAKEGEYRTELELEDFRVRSPDDEDLET